jgi:hypothetical protein
VELPLNFLLNSPTVAETAAVIVEHQVRKLGEQGLDRILTELESISDEEAEQHLSDQSKRNSGHK